MVLTPPGLLIVMLRCVGFPVEIDVAGLPVQKTITQDHQNYRCGHKLWPRRGHGAGENNLGTGSVSSLLGVTYVVPPGAVCAMLFRIMPH
jgi:hypothetical protein